MAVVLRSQRKCVDDAALTQVARRRRQFPAQFPASVKFKRKHVQPRVTTTMTSASRADTLLRVWIRHSHPYNAAALNAISATAFLSLFTSMTLGSLKRFLLHWCWTQTGASHNARVVLQLKHNTHYNLEALTLQLNFSCVTGGVPTPAMTSRVVMTSSAWNWRRWSTVKCQKHCFRKNICSKEQLINFID